MVVVVIYLLLQADEQDRVMKRKARFGSLTTSPDSLSVAVCVSAFIVNLLLNFTVVISQACRCHLHNICRHAECELRQRY